MLRDDIWEVLFNGFVETSQAFHGEEDENAEKERYECKEILFDGIKEIINALEKRCDRLESGVKDMSKAMEEREKEKCAETASDSKSAI